MSSLIKSLRIFKTWFFSLTVTSSLIFLTFTDGLDSVITSPWLWDFTSTCIFFDASTTNADSQGIK